jgi:hypothetical protein
MKKPQFYAVIQFENGWDYAPGEKTTFFTQKKEAMKMFNKHLRDIKEAKKEGDFCNETKVLLTKVEIGKTLSFYGYGDFDGEVIKLAEFEE